MIENRHKLVNLGSDASFELLGKSFGGTLQDSTLTFNNEIFKGQLIKASPEKGLWIQIWKFTTFEKIILHKQKTILENKQKFILIYFLNPSIFSLNHNSKNVNVSCAYNNIFLSSNIDIDFSVVPKQPFYVVDIAFTESWLLNQFMDAHEDVKKTLNEYMNRSKYTIVKEPSSVEEFKLLHELEHSMPLRLSDNLFVRSRVYCLIASFVSKIAKHTHTDVIKKKIDYDQIANMDTIIQNNLKAFPKLDILAKKVNLSVSSLLRQFKFLYGKSIYEYYVEKKMEYAKKMLLETGTSIKNMANYLGYKQSSHFIKAFVKYHGYSPGTLKALNNDWITL